MAPAVHFPIYRQYTKARQRANNAMVSFLAGSALASHTLRLTTGSNRLLPEIFPAVPHIARFNLRPDAAADVLGAAGPHLATVTIPYALAIHEDFVTQCIRWIRDTFGFPPPGTVSSIRSWNDIDTSNMHEALVAMTGDALDQHGSADLELFHLYRLMRNCHIHNGGNVTNALRRQVSNLSSGPQDRWRKLTRREADALVRGDRAGYSLLDVFSVFAVTKGLGRGVNALLQAGLTQAHWAEACVDDYRQESSRTRNSEAWGRGLIGHARDRYGAVGLSKPHLFRAAFDMGAWLDPTKYP